MDSFKEFVEHIVTYRLAGHYLPDVLNLYIIYNSRPTDIARKLKINRHMVRNVLSGVRRITGNWVRCSKYFNSTYDAVMKIEPIIKNKYCILCDEVVRDGVNHIRFHHHELVNDLTNKVLNHESGNV